MVCGLQIGLFIAGVWLMTRTLVRFGTMELRTPATVFAGIVLALQLPIGAGVGFAVGGAEGIKAAREGLEPSVATARVLKKYWWLDLVVPGVAAGLAGLIVMSRLRPVVYEPPPPDEPIGITDHRVAMAEKWAANDKLVRDRRRRHTATEDDDENQATFGRGDRQQIEARIGD